MTFYLDASVPVDVSRALALVRTDILFPGAPGCPISSPAIPDPVWLPIAGANDWIVLMRDKHIRKRPGERLALTHAGVRAFCFTQAGNYSKWRMLQLLANRWDDIAVIADNNPGPYIYSVTLQGLRQVM